jgi:hypothetical protein
MKKLTLTIILTAIAFQTIYSQSDISESSEAESPFSISADFVNRYVWRGLLYSPNPNIQPTFDFTKGNLSIGAWGSYAMAIPYAEVDLYISYSIGNFTLTLNDYYVENEFDLPENKYFNWTKTTTPHSLEGSITYNGTENLPLTLTAATFFYGNDWDENGSNLYSTYFEIGYGKQMGNTLVNLFVGGTPATGLYSDKASIVNVGVGLSREISISSNFKLPIFGSLVINPSAQDIFMVFGITLQ